MINTVRRDRTDQRLRFDLTTVLLSAAIAAVGVLFVASRVAGIDAPPPPPGLRQAGTLTDTLLPLTKVVRVAAAVGVIGALLTALLSHDGRGPASALSLVPPRHVRVWALVWALAAAATAVLSVSDIAAVSVVDVARSESLRNYVWVLPQARALLVAALCALVVAAAASIVRTDRLGIGVLLIIAAGGAGAPALTGHAATAANHNLATGSLLVHVLAFAAWVGGLLGIILYLRRDHVLLARAVPRFSAVALACYVLVVGSGIVVAATRIGTLGDLFATPYGWLVLGKVLAALALGGMGWLHRRRTVPAVLERVPRAFLRLAGGELIIMAGTIGLAVALSQAPTP